MPLDADFGPESLELSSQVDNDFAVGVMAQSVGVFLVLNAKLQRLLAYRRRRSIQAEFAPALRDRNDAIGQFVGQRFPPRCIRGLRRRRPHGRKTRHGKQHEFETTTRHGPVSLLILVPARSVETRLSQYFARTVIVPPAGASVIVSFRGSKSLCGSPCTVTDCIGFPSGCRRRSTTFLAAHFSGN